MGNKYRLLQKNLDRPLKLGKKSYYVQRWTNSGKWFRWSIDNSLEYWQVSSNSKIFCSWQRNRNSFADRRLAKCKVNECIIFKTQIYTWSSYECSKTTKLVGYKWNVSLLPIFHFNRQQRQNDKTIFTSNRIAPPYLYRSW